MDHDNQNMNFQSGIARSIVRNLASLAILGALVGFIFGEANAKLITGITVTPLNAAAGEQSIYEVTLVSSQNMLPNDRLVFQFPSGFDASGVLVASAISGIDGGLIVTSATTSEVILTRDNTGNTVAGSTSITVRFGNVTNHTT
ncbi:MAG: hypothetical protein D6814_04365, partial [Calditrichaeota bacterium]